MNLKKVSVIVPVYNSEKYFPRCVQALMNQTLQELEIILVDDGSTDSSGKMCDEYVKQDCRIRVIHTENRGVAAARQTGLDAAGGEYVIWADSDDWMESDMYEKMYCKAKETNADLVICGFFNVHIDGQCEAMKICAVPEDHSGCIEAFADGKLSPSLWDKLLKRSLIQKYGITFHPGINNGEDLLFLFKYLFTASEKSVVVFQNLYYYEEHLESQSHSYTEKKISDVEKVFAEISASLHNEQLIEKILIQRKRHWLFYIFYEFERYENKQILSRMLTLYFDDNGKLERFIRWDHRIVAMCLKYQLYQVSRFIIEFKRFLKKILEGKHEY